MAVRKTGPVWLPRFCAEHRHEIPGFEKASEKINTLTQYDEVFKYEQRDLARAGKLVGTGAGALTIGVTGGIAAAPAVGGAIGTAIAATPAAAATSYGLALLGGGSIAAGGLGMAGGTMVVATVGGAFGSAIGASVLNAYVCEDDSFHIEMLQGGRGTPVIVCNGFLSESGKGWGEWFEIVGARYPDSPVYRVHWGSKELKDLGLLTSLGALKGAGASQIKQAAMSATKAGAKKLGPLAFAMAATGLAKNPWHVAKNRANKTGVIVADLIARTTADSYVLIGHSLGARAMARAAQTLGTDPKDRPANAAHGSCPRLEAVHLLGAAIGARSDVETLTAHVDGAVYTYHSGKRRRTQVSVRHCRGGPAAAGLNGFRTDAPKLKNVDVSEDVGGHTEYSANVELR